MSLESALAAFIFVKIILTYTGMNSLRSQIATSTEKDSKGGRRYLQYVLIP